MPHFPLLLVAAFLSTLVPGFAQQSHAGLYTEYRLGDPVEKRKPNANNEIDLSGGLLVDNAVALPSKEEPTLKQLLSSLASRSALVVRATALSFQSEFTPDRSFLFSDWKFKLAEVLKNGEHQYFSPGDVVTVTRTGGALIWNGRHVVAHDTAFPAFAVGHDYLLYLLLVPNEAGVLRATNGGSFEMSEAGVRYLSDPSDKNDPLAAKRAAATVEKFLDQAKAAIDQAKAPKA